MRPGCGSWHQPARLAPGGDAATLLPWVPCVETSPSSAASNPPPPARRSRPLRRSVRKVTGITKPNASLVEAMDAAALKISDITETLLAGLPARRQPPKTVPPLRRPEVRARLGLSPTA